MNKLFGCLFLSLSLLALPAKAANVIANGWTTTTNVQSALAALGISGVITNSEQIQLVMYARPALRFMIDPIYVNGDTNSYWLVGANPSIPDFTIDYYLSNHFTTRYMLTPEGPLVANNFGDSTSFPGLNVFIKQTIATNTTLNLIGATFEMTSNTYPTFAWSQLGNNGCISWLSNSTLYMICTNSITGKGSTNLIFTMAQ